MLGVLFFVMSVVVVPVVTNKTTEVHFEWIKPYLRQIWTGIFAFFSVYLLLSDDSAKGFIMKLHHSLPGWQGYVATACVGAMTLCAYWWFTGKVVPHSISDASVIVPPTDPIIHIEPERVVVWSTGPNQKVGEFYLTLSNTGTEAIDHISVDEDYFVALKSRGGMVIKNMGGVPINSEVCEELENKKSCQVFVNFSPSIEVMNKVVKNNGLPSLRGVRLTFRYRRKTDGRDYRVVRGYGVAGPHAEGLICAGAPGDPAPIELRDQFVSVSEIIPYLDLSQYWTSVTHAIGQDANGKLTSRYY